MLGGAGAALPRPFSPRYPLTPPPAYKRNQTLQFVWTGVETNVTDVSTLAFALDTIYCTPSLSGLTPQELAQVRRLDGARPGAVFAKLPTHGLYSFRP